METRIIAFANHKGGVGKTTSAVNIGAALNKSGKRVLLIDLDPQANLSQSLGINEHQTNIYGSLIGKYSLIPHIIEFGTYEIIPSTIDLAGAEIELSSEVGREYILQELINPIKKFYDFIIIDCPPSLGLLTINALTCADEVIIPLQAEFFAMQGLAKLTDVIEKIKIRLNKNLKIGGIILTQFDSRKNLNKEVLNAVSTHFPSEVFTTKIRENIALAEAQTEGLDIFRYNEKCNGAEDYMALSEEILKR